MIKGSYEKMASESVSKKITKKLKKVKAKKRAERLATGKVFWEKHYEKVDSKYLKKKRKAADKVPIDENLIFFESFLGRSIADSPYAIFEEIRRDPAYSGYKFVWSVDDVKKHQYLEKYPRTSVVKRKSAAYYELIAKAHYVINNITNNITAPKKPGQIYIQTWHGTPLKRLGCDIELDGNSAKSVEKVHEQYRREADTFDYLLSPSHYATEKLSSAFGLSPAEKEKKVIETGYPRNAFLFNYTEAEKRAIKNEMGIPDDKKVILYCTTWREQNKKTGIYYKYDLELDLEKLYRDLGDTACVVMRMHYNHKNTKIDFESYKGFLFDGTNVDDVNRLFVISDVLVTDYSSVMFDFADLRRPIVFYMYDRDVYENEVRGFYFDPELLPGPITTTQNELTDALNKVISEPFIPDEKYKEFNKKFNPLDSGNAAREALKKLIPEKKELTPDSPELIKYNEKKAKKSERENKRKQNKFFKKFDSVSKKITYFFRCVGRFSFATGYREGAYCAYVYKHTRVNKKIVLYESFFGRGMLCGPYALFKEILNDPRLHDTEHFWVISGKENVKRFKRENKNHRVHFVLYGSRKYIKMLSKAGYLINNTTFPSYFNKKPEQIYINTWHGVPLKSLGYDMPSGKIETTNTIRNMLHTDYMVSASPFLTEVYLESFKLHEIYTGKIIEEGYPRLDIIDEGTREERIDELLKHGVEIDKNKKIILYAPTWRGKSYANPDRDVSGLFEAKARLEELIDTNEYQILIKPHQRLYQVSKKNLGFPFIVPAEIDANVILKITDILVSDFSSIFYDFLRTGKPVLFLMEDYKGYLNERGFYESSLKMLPGPMTDNIEELASYINDIDAVAKKWADKYKEVAIYAGADAAPGISKRIVDIVFFGKEDGYNIKKVTPTKKKLLISRKQMGINGITTSMLSLLNQIDYDKYDVTLMLEKNAHDCSSGFVERINPRVRVYYRTKMPPMTAAEVVFYRLERARFSHKEIRSKGLKREWRRLFGDTTFDSAVDFSGYIYFDAAILLCGAAAHKSIWLHNDMKAEYDNKNKSYRQVFALYSLFDSVVACGREIMRVNAEKIPERYDLKSRITYAGNTIDYERILSEAEKEPCITVTHENPVTHGKITNFLTIGRMSPEKNQKELIRGFKVFHDENPDSRLYILGSGKLLHELNLFIAECDLADYVIMPGNVKNPYPFLRECDCFILPSIYEGLPMTVYEARVLHKPIIMSDFESASECETENGQLVIGKTAEEIYHGMVKFKEGKVPAGYTFDPRAYNRQKLDEFYKATGV